MRDLLKAICAAATLVLPMTATAQGTAAFDGTYRGISITVAKYSAYNPFREGRCPPPSSPTPARMRIANGTVEAGRFQGTITPEGVLQMRNERGFLVNGRVGPDGSVQAQGAGPYCVWNYVWQKAG